MLARARRLSRFFNRRFASTLSTSSSASSSCPLATAGEAPAAATGDAPAAATGEAPAAATGIAPVKPKTLYPLNELEDVDDEDESVDFDRMTDEFEAMLDQEKEPRRWRHKLESVHETENIPSANASQRAAAAPPTLPAREARRALLAYAHRHNLDPKLMTVTQWNMAAWELRVTLDAKACCRRVNGNITKAFVASCICDDPACLDPSSPETGYVRCKAAAGNEWSKEDSVRLYRALAELPKEPRLLSHPEWNAIADQLRLGRSGMCCARYVLQWRPKAGEGSLRNVLDSRPWTDADRTALREAVNHYGKKWTVISLELRRSVYECHRQWNRIQNFGTWRKDEIERLREALSIYDSRQMSLIAAHVGTRTAHQCHIRINHDNVIKVKWDKAWDRFLCEAVQIYGRDWIKVAEHLRQEHGIDSCTNITAEKRFRYLQIGPFSWSAEADASLLRAVELFGTKNWKQVSEFVTGDRTRQRTCRERYELKFDPKYNRTPWTEEEIQRLDDIMKSIEKDDKWTRYNWIEIAAKLGTKRHPRHLQAQSASRYLLRKNR